jgi:hypothetical protein
MPQVLTTNARIVCPHGGVGTTANTSIHWTINGGFVTLDGDIGTLSCFNIPPCFGYLLQSMGLNATQMDGRKVMLATDFTQSFTGLPLVITEFHQVFDDSTPAPLPVGQPAPPLPPAVTDTTKPSVNVVVPPLAFSNSSPAPISATFSLSADFPMKWILTLIHQGIPRPAGAVDLTNGIPGSAVVTPSGGDWNSGDLTVNVVLQIPYLETFSQAQPHDFYMTGISQRGLSSYAKASFTVGP